ncbi:MAG: response regulator transcription factor, partial [Lachnospiraceae bacterium]|nr:response regulator transcription factor [Lachnospiraceae bacterium]
LFLSALSENRQIVEGLKTGGDDYLPKPYDIGVLLARVEARLRDSQHRKRFVNYKELKLDTISMTGSYEDKDLLLTQKEFLLLRMLSENITGYTDPDEIYRNIWGGEAGEDHNAIYTTVSRLNKKLDGVDAKLKVAYSRGDGYALEEV